ncbi:kinase-like protein [Pholiota conissans]|uniref:Kinase-like protein n=1 Tax=Pholiota conissans TaxID=109636 RepID=A0A9P6D0Y6_9AGAR|nr:kinase-like protein [Pholiota conissans]
MLAALGTTGGILNVVGALGGVPLVGAAGAILQEIVQTCDDVKVHKKKSRQLSNKCVQVLSILDEQGSKMEGTEIQQIADQLIPALERIQRRTKAYSNFNSVITFVKRNDIRDGLSQSISELETAMSLFHLPDPVCIFPAALNTHLGLFRAKIVLHTTQHAILQTVNSHHAEIQDLLLKILTEGSERQNVVELQNTGQRVAEDIMEVGQKQLRVLRESRVTEPGSSQFVPTVFDSQRYLQYQRGLIKLHRETGIPPTIKILNGEVTRTSEFAVDGGIYSDIWVGTWLGEEKVALKALRNIKAADPRAQKRFENEVKTWAELKHPHILPFYGIVTNLGQHMHMVSPWQENGNVLNYVKNHADANRLLLIIGAAQGLEYLHSQNVIHGNIKCANILVSQQGQSCICDFGMSKIIEEVTEKSASATLTAGGSARWLAPELIEGSSPTMGADTYSYAMAVLELLTERQPYADIKRDAAVIHDIIFLKRTPSRPHRGTTQWLSDALWDLMQQCWHQDSLTWPSMAEVTAALQVMVI